MKISSLFEFGHASFLFLFWFSFRIRKIRKIRKMCGGLVWWWRIARVQAIVQASAMGIAGVESMESQGLLAMVVFNNLELRIGLNKCPQKSVHGPSTSKQVNQPSFSIFFTKLKPMKTQGFRETQGFFVQLKLKNFSTKLKEFFC